MNERLIEIAKQAKVEHCVSHVRLQEYAELIVKECALIAGLMEHQGRKNIGAQILDNFGVVDIHIVDL